MNPTSILFVCTGNICRSPTADGVMRKLAADVGFNIIVDSAGTHAYHVGEAPDPRSQKIASAQGYDLSELRARKFSRKDFNEFDVILAMDAGHLHALQLLQPKDSHAKLALFLEYAGLGAEDIADPYYGDIQAFEQCLSRVEQACKNILNQIIR